MNTSKKTCLTWIARASFLLDSFDGLFGHRNMECEEIIRTGRCFGIDPDLAHRKMVEPHRLLKIMILTAFVLAYLECYQLRGGNTVMMVMGAPKLVVASQGCWG